MAVFLPFRAVIKVGFIRIGIILFSREPAKNKSQQAHPHLDQVRATHCSAINAAYISCHIKAHTSPIECTAVKPFNVPRVNSLSVALFCSVQSASASLQPSPSPRDSVVWRQVAVPPPVKRLEIP
ncbi:hypothetical protein AG1IA_08027 [Rhizoctonia solani AG-1 IA]|uniref:Uncharacterized protein n=1 Tax=Thanatephorus cucumeris (strain AG1-IA) TaxID=983506 RepID=L8WMA9_THACA|nr:hypothetical protein AG1IA_08027 [Rhizoctonia solani AG-1 IA]